MGKVLKSAGGVGCRCAKGCRVGRCRLGMCYCGGVGRDGCAAWGESCAECRCRSAAGSVNGGAAAAFPLTEADEGADEGVARFEYTTGQYVVAVAIAYVVLLITGDVMMTVAVGAGEAALPLGATRVVDTEP